MYVSMYARKYVIYVCMCVYVFCMNVCMYVFVCVYVCVQVNSYQDPDFDDLKIL
jgi:hypothetical protein